MLKIYLTLFIIILTITTTSASYPTPTGCTPFGVRLALGRSFFSDSESQQLSIWFNTRLECPKSFVTVEKDSSIKKIYCNTQRVAYNNYSSYVHRCSIDFLMRGDYYQYQTFGWTGNSSDPTVPYRSENMKAHLIDDHQNVKMVVLADWGYLISKVGVYDRLDSAFDSLLKNPNQPDLVCLGGDFGYDLSTANGRNYENFLIMLSQISVAWPCIFITGNHEYYTKNDFMLFNSSFELYNLTNNNITSLNLGTFTFLLFDPNEVFYHNASKVNLMVKLKSELERATKTKPIIAASHYPLACSAFYTYHCTQTLYYIQEYFELMIDYNVALYLGAHFHTYERLYPFVKGGQFNKILPPYTLTKQTKYLVSIVEGIAGNDELIVEFYIKILNFTAAVSFNQTGFGIVDVGPTQLKYEHFKAIDVIKPTDSITISYQDLISTNLQVQ